MRAAEVKRMIEWILGNADVYTVDTTTASTAASESSIGNSVRGLSLHSSQRNGHKGSLSYGKPTENPSTAKNFR